MITQEIINQLQSYSKERYKTRAFIYERTVLNESLSSIINELQEEYNESFPS